MDVSTTAEGRELVQKGQKEKRLMQEEQKRDELVEMVIPPGPPVLPQASTPVSQTAPAFFPESLPIPSQPVFSHVSVHVNIFLDVIFCGGCKNVI